MLLDCYGGEERLATCNIPMVASAINNVIYLVLLNVWEDLCNTFIRLKTTLFNFIENMAFCIIIDSIRMI